MSRKTQIFFDANPLVKSNKSGVGYFTDRLVRALSETFPEDIQLHGHYYGSRGGEELPNSPNIDYAPSRLVPERAVNISRRLGFYPPLSAFYRSSIDIALFPNFVSLPTNKKTLNVVFVHDLSFVDHPEFVSSRNGSFLRKAVPRSIKNANLVVTISEFTKSRIHKVYGVPLEQIYVMYIPPVQITETDENVLARHHLNDYLLFVGTLEPRKNISTLLKGYALLPKSVQEKTPLVLVGGKGWNDEELMSVMSKLKNEGHNIIQTGYATNGEKATLYKHATICVMPSHYEGFGMPILEAMQYGRPVICSDIPVFREVAGDSARYFDKDSPEALAELLGELLNDKQELKRLEKKSQERINNFPTWTKIAKDFYAYLLSQTQK